MKKFIQKYLGPKISCSILQYHTGKNKNRKIKQTLKMHGKSIPKDKIINIAKLYRLLGGFLNQTGLFGPLVNFYNVFWCDFSGKIGKHTKSCFWHEVMLATARGRATIKKMSEVRTKKNFQSHDKIKVIFSQKVNRTG